MKRHLLNILSVSLLVTIVQFYKNDLIPPGSIIKLDIPSAKTTLEEKTLKANCNKTCLMDYQKILRCDTKNTISEILVEEIIEVKK